ncbi:MAG TPA: hypothetical protein VKS44_11605 [Candidatus Acidoferrales bacterium]|nr:hypothetical protein [Candidatus Acidoferrales bacterium]
MRVSAVWILVFGLAASPAIAAASKGDNGSAAAESKGDAAAKANANAGKDAAAKTKSADAPANASKAPSANTPAKPAPAGMEGELQQLRDLLETQAKQLQEQNEQLKEQEKKMESLQRQLNASGASRATAAEIVAGTPATANTSVPPSTSVGVSGTLAASESSSSSIVTKSVASGPAMAGGKADSAQTANPDEPAALHYKGVTMTPVGFMAAETVWRQRALSADVNTPFNAAPVPASSQYNVGEFNASGRQSRIGMLVEGKLKDMKIGGYYEADFLSAGTTSNSNESNSYTFRQRQFWGQAAFASGWTITGGQMWSLVTETGSGVDNRTEVLPMTVDAQYHIGFSWARQYGFRIAKDFNNKFWLALSVENPQTTFGAHGQSSNFLLGTAGNPGGLYNPTANYSFNAAPDFILKAVAQNNMAHLELFGVISTFRDRVFPTGASPFNDKRVGGGVGANARLWFFDKHMDLGVHGLVGDGVGRYGTGGLPDATVRPDGTLALIHSYQGLGTWEFHYPKFDLYMNVGAEYAARTAYVNGSGAGVGYGSPLFNNSGCWNEPTPGSGGYAPGAVANCTADTRNLIEGTVGFWYRFYKGSKGTVQWGPQYSYYVRNTWRGTATTGGNPNGEPQGQENMFFTSFRYYLP